MKLKSLLHPLRAYKNRKRYNFYKSDAFKKLVDTNPKKALEIFWMIQKQYPLDWSNPQTLDEKTFWLEGMTNTQLWTEYSDKFLVREHIKELGLTSILPKLYGVWNQVDEIDFNALPEKFVIKCTHDCGSSIIIPNKSKANLESIRHKLNLCLHRKYGYQTCEPHYTRIQPRIIAEELLENEQDTLNSSSLVDYKFFCCDGVVQCCMVCYDRVGLQSTKDIYDVKSWKRYTYMSERYQNQNLLQSVPRPSNLDEMVHIAQKLATGFPFIRVDLYNIADRRIVFGELTFTPHGGLQACFNQKGQQELGALITLPSI